MFSLLIGGPTDLIVEEIQILNLPACVEESTSSDIVLPSNTEWRNDNYFQLVQLHRNIKEDTVLPTKYLHEHREDNWELFKQCGPLSAEGDGPCSISVGWTHEDIFLTSRLLTEAETRRSRVLFCRDDFEQTRRVVTLAFDILRFKPVLKETLEDNTFFQRFPQFEQQPWNVWLLLYDVYRRNFERRKNMTTEDRRMFRQEKLDEIDKALWENKVSLAATISRVRIKRIAHRIEKLLPPHLRTSWQILDKTIVGGWVNTFKINVDQLCRVLESKLGLNEIKECPTGQVPPFSFINDHIVPAYVHCHTQTCAALLNSELIRMMHIVIQDRSQCLGVVAFLKVVETLELCGSVAQTHIVTPPSSAYFASMIAHNPNIDQLLIFSAGSKKSEYEEYFEKIGASNVTLFSEQFADITADNQAFHNVIAVMVCPPNSDTAIIDPIDVAMSRNGDISVLYALTDDYYNPNVDESLLEVQRRTLLKAMSLPKMQALVYETHSRSEEENNNMIESAVIEINQQAAYKHYEEKQSHSSPVAAFEPVDGEPTCDTTLDDIFVQVPLCDLYEIMEVPDLCPTRKGCLLFAKEGVYLAVAKRKEITRLDPKYMINMAEARGLFGKQGEMANVQVQKKKITKTRSFAWREQALTKPKVELERLTAPTIEWKHKDMKYTGDILNCERFATHVRLANCDRADLPKLWWKSVLLYIKRYLHNKPKFPQLILKRPVVTTNKQSYPTISNCIAFDS